MIRRREFVTLLGGAAALPLVAHALHPGMPTLAFLVGGNSSVHGR
jgi:hypothetical protein